MLVHADFSRRVVVTAGETPWLPSPAGGVERVMLDRIGDERARATSLVRYASGASFAVHAHPGGEEILVLDGVFADDDGAWPAGCYLRNPPGSQHRPFSPGGAVIFVKLMQMPVQSTPPLRIDTRAAAAWRNTAQSRICPLFADAHETVFLQRLTAAEALPLQTARGAELLVVDGALTIAGRHAPRWSWARVPAGDRLSLHAGADGATVYIKLGLPMTAAAAQ